MFDQIQKLYTQYKNAILLVGLLIAAAFAYFTFFYESSPAPLSSTQIAGQNGGQNSELLQLLLQVRSIQLDDGIFTDEAFRELDSTVQEIPPQQTGRANPFAPFNASTDTNGGQ